MDTTSRSCLFKIDFLRCSSASDMTAASSLACILLFIMPALISSEEEGESVIYMIIIQIHILNETAHVP